MTFSGTRTLCHTGTLQGLSPVQDRQWSNIAEVDRTVGGIYCMFMGQCNNLHFNALGGER